MNDRANLIERAAALLRERGSSSQVQPSASSDRITTTMGPSKALARQMLLDRNQLAQHGIIMPSAGASRVVEEFRIIKRNLMATWQTDDGLRDSKHAARLIMVTSARPREGKTFSALNLALSFSAEANLTVVLIDADLARRDVAKITGAPFEPGLTEVLSRSANLADVLIQTDVPNFIILPPGTTSPDLSELLSSQVTALFAEIAARYVNHLIIIDAAPCLASSDSVTLAPLVNQVVFVIEAGHTQQAEVESSLNLISSCPRISLLLNKSAAGTADHFGSYSSYSDPDEKYQGEP
jgi:protein-tyrosine kinase